MAETVAFLRDPDLTLYCGDAREVLATLEPESVDCCVTSPAYWGLRDYGTDGQLGLEGTPDEYVAALVAVFREVRRVLTPHGTVWLNLGDSYVSSSTYNTTQTLHTEHGWKQDGDHRPNVQAAPKRQAQVRDGKAVHDDVLRPFAVAGLPPKNLVGIPWRVAFALQDDGWILRSDIIWSKVNPMPESVRDRPTKAHEYLFLLSKRPSYYFDQESVREPHQYDGRIKTLHDHAVNGSHENYANMGTPQERWPNSGRNIRSVWSIATQPYPEAHFATFPEELPRRAIMAGCPEQVCRVCGKPRERVIERSPMEVVHSGRLADGQQADRVNDARTATSGTMTKPPTAETIGWTDCDHDDYRTGVVLDPFAGAGTTALVARKLGRHVVGIELNPDYCALIATRLQQLSLLA